MKTLLISVLLIASVALGQTSPKTTKNAGTGSTKPTAASATAAKTTSPGSSTAPPKPLPDHPLSTKLQSNDNVNPNYEKEKARGRGIKRDYAPRRTASGARPDTMNKHKP